MDPYTTSILVQQHLDDLRRDASKLRLVRTSRKHKSERHMRSAMRLQRAPAP